MSDYDDHDARVQGEIAEALARHGIEKDRITVTYADVLQDYEISVSGHLTDAQIEAVWRITREGGCADFENPENARRLLAVELREAAAMWKARAVETGEASPDQPTFNPDNISLPEFARQLERACDIEPGTMLSVAADGALKVRLAMLNFPDFERLLAVVMASLSDTVEIRIVGEDGDQAIAALTAPRP